MSGKVGVLLHLLDEAYGRKAWHGPNLRGSIRGLGEPEVTQHVSLGAAYHAGAVLETTWRLLRLKGEPPMTRFVAKELATDHWFDISAARRDLGYSPKVTMAAGTAELIAHYRGGNKF